MIKNVLVVCIGNICRSPMAEGLLRRALPNVQIVSAGLGALVGYPADPNAIELLSDLGLDISQHRAQQLSASLARQADLILVMDKTQKTEIQRLYPFVTGKVYRLGEHERFDIPDPYREDRVAFENALRLTRNGVAAWVPRIQSLHQ